MCRNKPFTPYRYKCKFNGAFVTAIEADSERGYADVVVKGNCFPPRCHRLFGKVEFIHVD